MQIQNRKLREDFYYRLSMISIYLAPLRERTGDIALLTRYFLDLAAAKYSKNMSSVSSDAMRLFEAYGWPGNVRQLENLIGQIVITNNEAEISPEMLPPEMRKGTHRVSTSFNSRAGTKPHKTIPSIQEMERCLILEALELTTGSIPNAAKQLGLSEATLYRKIKKFGITRTFAK